MSKKKDFKGAVDSALNQDPPAGGSAAMQNWLSPTNESRVEQVKVEEISDPAWRRPIDPQDPGYRAIKASVRASGILQPVLLRPLEAGGFEVISGLRRVRAARDTFQDLVPATVRVLSDVEAIVGSFDALLRDPISSAEREGLSARLRDGGMPPSEADALLGALHVAQPEAGAAIVEAPPAPAVEAVAAAPVVEEAVAPAVEEAEAPIVEEEQPAAPVEEAIAPPIVEEETLAPAVEGEVAAPVAEDEAVAPAVEEEAEAPVVEAEPTAPAAEAEVEAPAVEAEPEAPAAEAEVEAPAVEAEPEAPAAEVEAEAPVVEPAVEEETAAPAVEAEPEAPPAAEVEAEAPVADDEASAAVAEDTAAAVAEEEAPAPVAEEVAAPVAEAEPAAPVAEPEAPWPTPKRRRGAPAADEEAATAEVTELIGAAFEAGPAVEEPPAAPVVPEPVQAAPPAYTLKPAAEAPTEPADSGASRVITIDLPTAGAAGRSDAVVIAPGFGVAPALPAEPVPAMRPGRDVTGSLAGRVVRDPRFYATAGTFVAVWAVVFLLVAIAIGNTPARVLITVVVIAIVGFLVAILSLAVPRRSP